MRHALYNSNLRDAILFEDFVCHELGKRGITFSKFSSPEYQTLIGENSAGVEIKLDRKWQSTGNLFIEIAERPSVENQWKPSGPFKGDNTWLVAIGDYRRFWIFGAKMLRRLYERGVEKKQIYDFKENETARGYLMPVKEADDFCELAIDPKSKPPSFPD